MLGYLLREGVEFLSESWRDSPIISLSILIDLKNKLLHFSRVYEGLRRLIDRLSELACLSELLLLLVHLISQW